MDGVWSALQRESLNGNAQAERVCRTVMAAGSDDATRIMYLDSMMGDPEFVWMLVDILHDNKYDDTMPEPNSTSAMSLAKATLLAKRWNMAEQLDALRSHVLRQFPDQFDMKCTFGQATAILNRETHTAESAAEFVNAFVATLPPLEPMPEEEPPQAVPAPAIDEPLRKLVQASVLAKDWKLPELDTLQPRLFAAFPEEHILLAVCAQVRSELDVFTLETAKEFVAQYMSELPENPEARLAVLAKQLMPYSECDLHVLASDSTTKRVALTKPTYAEGVGRSWEDAMQELGVEEKPMPNVLKVLNFFEFQRADCDVAEFWLEFARAVQFDTQIRRDGINVAKLEPGRFLVAYYKCDQRRVTLPAGLVRRFAPPMVRRGTTRVGLIDIFHALASVGTKQFGNVRCMNIEGVTALDVVATIRDMDRTQQMLERIQAHMTPAKERSALQNALCSAWSTVTQVIDEQRSATMRMEYSVYTEDWPKLSDYAEPGKAAFGYAALEHLPVKYEYFDAATGETKQTCLARVITEFAGKRAIVLSGARFFGKTYFACALAKELAVFYRDPDTPMEQLTFVFSSSVQALEKCDLQENKPVVLDDVDLGATMFWNASPMEFLKTACDTTKPGTLRILGRVVYLPAAPRVFTTNATSLREFVRLRDGGSISEEHYEAVARRVVFAFVQNPLYSPQQKSGLDDKESAERQERMERMVALRKTGLW